MTTKSAKKRYFKKETKVLQPKRHKALSAKEQERRRVAEAKQEAEKKPVQQSPKISRFITEQIHFLQQQAHLVQKKQRELRTILQTQFTLHSKPKAQKKAVIFESKKHVVEPKIPKKHSTSVSKNLLMGSILTVVVLIAVVFGFQVYLSWHQWESLQQEHMQLTKELLSWESIIKRYPTYRDAYFEAAMLAYRLGDSAKEQNYLEHVLVIDPDFKPAQELKILAGN